MGERKKWIKGNAPAAFKVAADIYFKKETNTEGRNILSRQFGFNYNSTGDIVNNFRYMMNGELCERDMNAYYTNYFLENILLIYGKQWAKNALNSVRMQLDYFASRNANMSKLSKVVENFEQNLSNEYAMDQMEQSIVENADELNKAPRAAIMEKIQRLEKDSAEYVQYRGIKVKRNNYLVGLIKILRGFKCQFCSESIPVKKGGHYVEAAHIKAKKEFGNESMNNILLLCPNHHKAFDLGTVVTMKLPDGWEFTVNGKMFSVPFDKLEK